MTRPLASAAATASPPVLMAAPAATKTSANAPTSSATARRKSSWLTRRSLRLRSDELGALHNQVDLWLDVDGALTPSGRVRRADSDRAPPLSPRPERDRLRPAAGRDR